MDVRSEDGDFVFRKRKLLTSIQMTGMIEIEAAIAARNLNEDSEFEQHSCHFWLYQDILTGVASLALILTSRTCVSPSFAELSGRKLGQSCLDRSRVLVAVSKYISICPTAVLNRLNLFVSWTMVLLATF